MSASGLTSPGPLSAGSMGQQAANQSGGQFPTLFGAGPVQAASMMDTSQQQINQDTNQLTDGIGQLGYNQQQLTNNINQQQPFGQPTPPTASAGNPQPIGLGGSPYVGNLPTNTLPVSQMSYPQLLQTLGMRLNQPGPGPIMPMAQPNFGFIK